MKDFPCGEIKEEKGIQVRSKNCFLSCGYKLNKSRKIRVNKYTNYTNGSLHYFQPQMKYHQNLQSPTKIFIKNLFREWRQCCTPWTRSTLTRKSSPISPWERWSSTPAATRATPWSRPWSSSG